MANVGGGFGEPQRQQRSSMNIILKPPMRTQALTMAQEIVDELRPKIARFPKFPGIPDAFRRPSASADARSPRAAYQLTVSESQYGGAGACIDPAGTGLAEGRRLIVAGRQYRPRKSRARA